MDKCQFGPGDSGTLSSARAHVLAEPCILPWLPGLFLTLRGFWMEPPSLGPRILTQRPGAWALTPLLPASPGKPIRHAPAQLPGLVRK